MRPNTFVLALTVTLPLAACNSQTAQTPQSAGRVPIRLAALQEPPTTISTHPRDEEFLRQAPRAAQIDPKLARTVIDYPTKEAPGTIIVSTSERRLYYVLADGKAIRYPVAVGNAGMAWAGTANIDRKLEWPDWNPPPEMLQRRPDLPKRLAGGPTNPIGARALYLAEGKRDTLFRIHGTNEPDKIGMAVSSGCIRMLNEDVVDLYNRVPIGSKVIVL